MRVVGLKVLAIKVLGLKALAILSDATVRRSAVEGYRVRVVISFIYLVVISAVYLAMFI